VELASVLDLSMNLPPPPAGVDFDDLLKRGTAVTMPAQRRRDLARLATRLGVAIIEDDPYWLLADGSLPPNAIRISLGSVRERRALSSALATLSRLLARRAPAQRPVI
jgi:hypothetical protein